MFVHRKILIVRLSALGDIVHVLPVQQALARSFPEASIHWLCEAPYQSLLRCVPRIDCIWAADTRRWRRRPDTWTEAAELFSRLRGEQFDITLDFQGLIKSALFSRLSNARRVIGFSSRQSREPAAGWFYDIEVEEIPAQCHVIRKNFALAARIGCRTEVDPVIPFNLPDRAVETVVRQLEVWQIPCPIVISPGAGWVTKRWAPERFARLARQIERELDHPVLFTYAAGEEILVETIQSTMPEARTLQTSILELAALSRQARLFAGGDTGPLHLAVASGTPAVAILGPAYPWRNGPFGRDDLAVTADRPCKNPYKRRCEGCYCMDIPVDRVFEAVRRRLGKNPEQT